VSTASSSAHMGVHNMYERGVQGRVLVGEGALPHEIVFCAQLNVGVLH
jgi:hypothetical protein